jgi:hypothetical protein
MKAKQQRSRKLYRIGKKERNIHFLNESKKQIVFNHKKNVDITTLVDKKTINYPVILIAKIFWSIHYRSTPIRF